ncbi:hypothetical protein RB601_000768 [Gaeumannomyces tritici]
MAGYGTVPTDKNATVAIIDPGAYLGDSHASRLSTTDIGVIAGVSVFFGILVIAIFAWQIRAIRDRKRLASGRSSPGADGGDSGGGQFRKGSGRSGDGEEEYGGVHARKDGEVELKGFDGVAPAATAGNQSRAPEPPAASFKPQNQGMLLPTPPLPPPPPLPLPPLPSAFGHSEHRFSEGSKEGAHGSHYTVTSLLKALREGKTKDSGDIRTPANMV